MPQILDPFTIDFRQNGIPTIPTFRTDKGRQQVTDSKPLSGYLQEQESNISLAQNFIKFPPYEVKFVVSQGLL